MTVANQATAENGFMARLKEQTWPLHKMAETRPLQRELTRGQLTQQAYADYLGQLLLIHRALEQALRRHRDSHDAIAAVFRNHQQREADLLDDLAFLGQDPENMQPLTRTAELTKSIEYAADNSPVSLLGYLYVLEGSTNGARFIARVVRKTYGFEERGLSYFDPYGDEQPQRWQAFKDDMEAIGLDGDQQQRIIEASNVMFKSIAAVSDAVYEQHGGRTDGNED